MHNKQDIITTYLDSIDAKLGFELYLKDRGIDTYYQFLHTICKDKYALKEVPIASSTMTKLLSFIFPDRNPILHTKIHKYILSICGYKECRKCNTIYTLDQFRPNKSKSDGLNCQCKTCQSSNSARTQPNRQAKYKSATLQRVVPWTNMEDISKFYSKCPEGYHVDHIVPLQGELVSGLHVLQNLQYLTAEENIRKHNKFIAE